MASYLIPISSWSSV